MNDPNTPPEERESSAPPPSDVGLASGPSGHVDWSKPRVAAILKAAVRCFARSGFDTTTAEIAADIGIPKSVIYHYFDDKTTLVREAQRFAYAEHLGKIKDALSAIHERTGKAVVDVLRQIWRVPESRSISFQLGIWSELRNDARVREQAVALRREHHRMIAAGVARSLGIDDPARTEPLSTLVTAALTGLSLEAFIEGNDELATQAHELFMGVLERGIERFAKRPDSDVPPASELDVELPAPYDALERGLS
ncbi:MAG TPA: TetR/AcrR family transcriptional regulator [Polyangiaceae bacterium]|nr:TetR/AcrR family transcriptional regulator [Polyangiaceae bacterium]